MRVAILSTDDRDLYRHYEVPSPVFGTAPQALYQGLASLPELEVHIVSCARVRLPAPAKLAPNVFFHSLIVPKIGWMRTAYQGCIRAIRKKLREIGPDLVHGQGTERDCALSAVFSGVPSLLTVHGNMRLIARVTKARPLSFLWLAARLERLTLPRARGVICITRYTQAAVAPLAQRTWVVPNAVDDAFFNIQPRPAPNAPQRLLCVGHICVRKNQNNFIRALVPLAQRFPLEVVFLGQAPPQEAYAREFLSLVQTQPWCKYEGFADRTRLKAQLAQASLLVLPSLEDNCPMVVLEAMAAGVPVVAARVGGVPELITEGQTGWFCDPLDLRSMQVAVEQALKKQPLAQQVAGQARQQAQARFHPQVIARRHAEIYREIVEQQTATGQQHHRTAL